jgi:sigma-54 dependent transcriptional regulator, acetoin dehydrogenase operon transcriptional activator AcoR
MTEETGSMAGEGRDAGTPATKAGLVLIHAGGHDPLDVPAVCVLGRRDTIIGREPPRGGVRIAQTAVSRLHARIAFDDGGWSVTDLESRNGTVLNGLSIRRAPLEDGDVLRIGDVLFRFTRNDADAYAAFHASPRRHEGIVGGFAIQRVASELARVALRELPILVLGETGTGKELAAQLVHRASKRPGPFYALNAAAVPATLIESELFGYKRGAFTGAAQDRLGMIRAADGGTLFLDEIGDMPLDAQSKLLRVLETREVVPLGGTTPERVDVRLVCATHRDLRRMVDAGHFRGDLYARINGYAARLPPLRERKEDVVPLVRHFLDREGRRDLSPTVQFIVAACQHAWPFNVRELEMAVRRAAAVADGPELKVECLPEDVRAAMAGYGARTTPESRRPDSGLLAGPLLEAGSSPSVEMLRELAARHHGNLSAIARALGRDRALVHRWMQRAAIELGSFRSR